MRDFQWWWIGWAEAFSGTFMWRVARTYPYGTHHRLFFGPFLFEWVTVK